MGGFTVQCRRNTNIYNICRREKFYYIYIFRIDLFPYPLIIPSIDEVFGHCAGTTCKKSLARTRDRTSKRPKPVATARSCFSNAVPCGPDEVSALFDLVFLNSATVQLMEKAIKEVPHYTRSRTAPKKEDHLVLA